MGRAALAGRRHRLGERGAEAEAVGETGEQICPRVGDETFAVRTNFYLCAKRYRFHLRVSFRA